MNDPEVIVGPWQGGEEYDMSEQEFDSAVEELLATTNQETLGVTIAGVLEFLTIHATLTGPYYITTEDRKAVTVIAVGDDATALLDMMPEHFKAWDEEADEASFLTDTDPGDEQDEPATESE